MRVILTGATGAAGLGILRALLSDESISHVTVLARRPLPAWVVLPGGTQPSPNDSSASPVHPKLSTTVLPSFLSYPPALLAEHDACIWALGKSQRGMDEKAYTEMTVGYLDAFLDASKAAGARSAEAPFRFAFVSGKSVDPTEKSGILFARVKGMAENHLLAHADSSNGTFKASILRPGYFFPSQHYPADAKHTRAGWERAADWLLGGAFRSTASYGITVEQIGAFAVQAVKGAWDGKGPAFENDEMKALLQTLGKQ